MDTPQALWHNVNRADDFYRIAGLLFLLLAASLHSDPLVLQYLLPLIKYKNAYNIACYMYNDLSFFLALHCNLYVVYIRYLARYTI